MRGLAALSQQFGDGSLRLTVWQNLVIPNVPDAALGDLLSGVELLGLGHRASASRAGLVACTGNAGCKYAATDTKRHAMQIAAYVDERLDLASPVNIHLTGCHHSCAQHYIGDIGLIGANVEVNDDMVEGYHVFVGGGYGTRRGIGREFRAAVPFDEIPALVANLLQAYLDRRSPGETFAEFTARHEMSALQSMVDAPVSTLS